MTHRALANSARLDAEQVRAGLLGDVAHALRHFGISFLERGAQLVTRQCPTCGRRSRPCVRIATNTGVWIDHARGCHGDILALLAGYSGLDTRRDFPRVLELGAQIAGLSSAEAPERTFRLAEQSRRTEIQRQHDAAARAAVRADMPARWGALARRHTAGEAYLLGRGLDPDVLRNQGDLVRYTVHGDPSLALRDLATGAIVGIQSRRPLGDRKIHTEFGSQVAGTALAGQLLDLDPDGVDVAVLVEGLADTLAAHLQWTGCAIFGAPGAEQLPTIAAAVARRVMLVRGWLLLAADDDAAGVTQAGKAIVAALDAGLTLAPPGASLQGERTVRLVELGEHHDLADAHAAGWRYMWPEQRPT